MKENYKTQEKIYDAEVLESSTFDENIIIKILRIIFIINLYFRPYSMVNHQIT